MVKDLEEDYFAGLEVPIGNLPIIHKEEIKINISKDTISKEIKTISKDNIEINIKTPKTKTKKITFTLPEGVIDDLRDLTSFLQLLNPKLTNSDIILPGIISSLEEKKKIIGCSVPRRLNAKH